MLSRLSASGFLLALLLAAAGNAHGDAPTGLDNSEREAPKAVQCVKVQTEARYRNYGYDHLVELSNRCDKAMTCTIKSGADNSTTKETLAAGETKTVMIFRGSPAREVKVDVACEPASAAAKP